MFLALTNGCLQLLATILRLRNRLIALLTFIVKICQLISLSKKLRVPSDKRRNKLKSVWDFISIENVTWVFSQPLTCAHMNWSEMKLQMPAHFDPNIGSFWNAAEMKCHMNKTCFHASLKPQTGMGLFCLSCERTH